MKTTGKIIKKLEAIKGTSKAGKEWQKQSFVIDNGEQYNNIFCFELFGDKVKILEKYNVGDQVDVEFNVNCNEYKGKYYTSLQAWRIVKQGNDIPEPTKTEKVEVSVEQDDLPF